MALASIFGQRTDTIDSSVLPKDASGAEAFRNRLNELLPSARTAKNVALSGAQRASDVMGLLGDYWESDISGLGDDYAFLVFGQSELFDDTGAPDEGASTEPRIIVIVEVADATAISQGVSFWETGGRMASEARYVFDFDPSRATTEAFSDAAYRQIPLRYQNYAYADRSLDWGIVPASNGSNYLVISNSRQSFFFALDQLLK